MISSTSKVNWSRATSSISPKTGKPYRKQTAKQKLASFSNWNSLQIRGAWSNLHQVAITLGMNYEHDIHAEINELTNKLARYNDQYLDYNKQKIAEGKPLYLRGERVDTRSAATVKQTNPNGVK